MWVLKSAGCAQRRAVAASITFEAGIIFHSIFIGITFGITSSADTARALAIALCFHQVGWHPVKANRQQPAQEWGTCACMLV